ncbi:MULTISPECIES: hypothetical protein [Xenorhabdus]|nr:MULTISPECIES: hypothetical protein [Xenorhabdus]
MRSENRNATIPCALGTRWERVAAWVINIPLTTQGMGKEILTLVSEGN